MIGQELYFQVGWLLCLDQHLCQPDDFLYTISHERLLSPALSYFLTLIQGTAMLIASLLHVM